MKKTILLFSVFCLLLNLNSDAQTFNYVPNSSFEQNDTCPFGDNDIYLANPWDTLMAGGGVGIGGGGGYYAKCASVSYCGVPFNAQGYQFAKSGTAYSCQYVYEPYFHGREYFQVKLKNALTIGKQYCTTFYISLCESAIYACDHIGAYLDDGSIQALNESWVIKTPQVESPIHVIMKDTLNWMQIQGSFTATGNESYLTLGNFTTDSLTDTAIVTINTFSGIPAFYYFDDVSVIESNSKINAGNDTTIAVGDSVLLGKSIEGLPVQWYDIQGNLLANSSEIQVHPTTTTSYVVKMDLCGFVSYDTVKVKVGDVGISNLLINNPSLSIYPNPANNNINIILPSDNVATYQIECCDIQGKVINTVMISSNNAIMNTTTFTNGIYILRITNVATNEKNYKKVIIQHEN